MQRVLAARARHGAQQPGAVSLARTAPAQDAGPAHSNCDGERAVSGTVGGGSGAVWRRTVVYCVAKGVAHVHAQHERHARAQDGKAAPALVQAARVGRRPISRKVSELVDEAQLARGRAHGTSAHAHEPRAVDVPKRTPLRAHAQ